MIALVFSFVAATAATGQESKLQLGKSFSYGSGIFSRTSGPMSPTNAKAQPMKPTSVYKTTESMPAFELPSQPQFESVQGCSGCSSCQSQEAPCNEWAGFCNMKQLDYKCACGGLKAGQWDCNSTSSCCCDGCGGKSRAGLFSIFHRRRINSCGSCSSVCDSCQSTSNVVAQQMAKTLPEPNLTNDGFFCRICGVQNCNRCEEAIAQERIRLLASRMAALDPAVTAPKTISPIKLTPQSEPAPQAAWVGCCTVGLE